MAHYYRSAPKTESKSGQNNQGEQMKNIGIGITAPEKACTDRNCPFHGTLKIHGRLMVMEVVSAKAYKTATVEKERKAFVKKYERLEKRRTKIKVHNPECIAAQAGDHVKIAETRPISKTKHFVIVEKVK
jgi:small subunit ribosomal protein S17